MPKAGPPTPDRGGARAGPRSDIRDMRAAFSKRRGESAEDRERARAFIDGKIAMVESDPTMSPAERAAAIAELKGRQ
jgi:hypothetical protein